MKVDFVQINAISSSSAVQSSNNNVEQLRQEKTSLEMYIAQLSSQDAEKNSDAIKKLQSQLKEIETEISQAQGSSSANRISTTTETNEMAALTEKIGPAYQVDISDKGIALQAQQVQEAATEEQAAPDSEKIVDEKFL